MFTKPSASVLEILQTPADEVLASDNGEIRFTVRVYNPGVMKVPFRAGFICAAGFELVSVETKDADTSNPKSAFSIDHPVVASRVSDDRMFYLADKEFVAWAQQSERFVLAFRREKPFAPGEVLAFTVRVLMEGGEKVLDAPLSFTFN